LRPPLPGDFPPANGLIDFAQKDADKYMWYGWGPAESGFRWSDESEASVVAVSKVNQTRLRISLAPYLAEGHIPRQRLGLSLNGQSLATWNLKNEGFNEYDVPIPKGALQQQNILKFDLPDANSPRHFRLSPDQRLLGVSVQFISFEP